MPIQDDRNALSNLTASIAFLVLSAGIPTASAALGATFADPLLRNALGLPNTVSHDDILRLAAATSAASASIAAFILMIPSLLTAKTQTELMNDFVSSFGGILAGNIAWLPAVTLFAFFMRSNRNLDDCLNALKISAINLVGNFLVTAFLVACSYCFYHGRRVLRESEAAPNTDAAPQSPQSIAPTVVVFRHEMGSPTRTPNATTEIPVQSAADDSANLMQNSG